jgi:hypothetical protein
VVPGILLQGFTDQQLDEFTRICTAMEKSFELIQKHEKASRGVTATGGISEFARDFNYRRMRERKGKYGDE